MILAADTVFDFENFKGLIYGILEQLHDLNNEIEILVCFTHRFGDVEKWFREGIEIAGFTKWYELPLEDYPEPFQHFIFKEEINPKTGKHDQNIHFMVLKK
jgi:hypothetical protein